MPPSSYQKMTGSLKKIINISYEKKSKRREKCNGINPVNYTSQIHFAMSIFKKSASNNPIYEIFFKNELEQISQRDSFTIKNFSSTQNIPLERSSNQLKISKSKLFESKSHEQYSHHRIKLSSNLNLMRLFFSFLLFLTWIPTFFTAQNLIKDDSDRNTANEDGIHSEMESTSPKQSHRTEIKDVQSPYAQKKDPHITNIEKKDCSKDLIEHIPGDSSLANTQSVQVYDTRSTKAQNMHSGSYSEDIAPSIMSLETSQGTVFDSNQNAKQIQNRQPQQNGAEDSNKYQIEQTLSDTSLCPIKPQNSLASVIKKSVESVGNTISQYFEDEDSSDYMSCVDSLEPPESIHNLCSNRDHQASIGEESDCDEYFDASNGLNNNSGFEIDDKHESDEKIVMKQSSISVQTNRHMKNLPVETSTPLPRVQTCEMTNVFFVSSSKTVASHPYVANNPIDADSTLKRKNSPHSTTRKCDYGARSESRQPNNIEYDYDNASLDSDFVSRNSSLNKHPLKYPSQAIAKNSNTSNQWPYSRHMSKLMCENRIRNITEIEKMPPDENGLEQIPLYTKTYDSIRKTIARFPKFCPQAFKEHDIEEISSENRPIKESEFNYFSKESLNPQNIPSYFQSEEKNRFTNFDPTNSETKTMIEEPRIDILSPIPSEKKYQLQKKKWQRHGTPSLTTFPSSHETDKCKEHKLQEFSGLSDDSKNTPEEPCEEYYKYFFLKPLDTESNLFENEFSSLRRHKSDDSGIFSDTKDSSHTDDSDLSEKSTPLENQSEQSQDISSKIRKSVSQSPDINSQYTKNSTSFFGRNPQKQILPAFCFYMGGSGFRYVSILMNELQNKLSIVSQPGDQNSDYQKFPDKFIGSNMIKVSSLKLSENENLESFDIDSHNKDHKDMDITLDECITDESDEEYFDAQEYLDEPFDNKKDLKDRHINLDECITDESDEEYFDAHEYLGEPLDSKKNSVDMIEHSDNDVAQKPIINQPNNRHKSFINIMNDFVSSVANYTLSFIRVRFSFVIQISNVTHKIAIKFKALIPIAHAYSRGNETGSAHDDSAFLPEVFKALKDSTSVFYIYENEKFIEIECQKFKFLYCELYVLVKRFFHADAAKKEEVLFLIETYLSNKTIISSEKADIEIQSVSDGKNISKEIFPCIYEHIYRVFPSNIDRCCQKKDDFNVWAPNGFSEEMCISNPDNILKLLREANISPDFIDFLRSRLLKNMERYIQNEPGIFEDPEDNMVRISTQSDLHLESAPFWPKNNSLSPAQPQGFRANIWSSLSQLYPTKMIQVFRSGFGRVNNCLIHFYKNFFSNHGENSNEMSHSTYPENRRYRTRARNFLEDTTNSTLAMTAVPVDFVLKKLRWAKERGKYIKTSFFSQYYSSRAFIIRTVNGTGEYFQIAWSKSSQTVQGFFLACHDKIKQKLPTKKSVLSTPGQICRQGINKVAITVVYSCVTLKEGTKWILNRIVKVILWTPTKLWCFCFSSRNETIQTPISPQIKLNHTFRRTTIRNNKSRNGTSNVLTRIQKRNFKSRNGSQNTLTRTLNRNMKYGNGNLIKAHHAPRRNIKSGTGRPNAIRKCIGGVAKKCYIKISHFVGGLRNWISEALFAIKHGMSRSISYSFKLFSVPFEYLGKTCSAATGYGVKAIKGMATLTKKAVNNTYNFTKRKFNDFINFVKRVNQKPVRQIVSLQNRKKKILPKLPRRNVPLKPKMLNISRKSQKYHLKKKFKITKVYFEGSEVNDQEELKMDILKNKIQTDPKKIPRENDGFKTKSDEKKKTKQFWFVFMTFAGLVPFYYFVLKLFF